MEIMSEKDDAVVEEVMETSSAERPSIVSAGSIPLTCVNPLSREPRELLLQLTVLMRRRQGAAMLCAYF